MIQKNRALVEIFGLPRMLGHTNLKYEKRRVNSGRLDHLSTRKCSQKKKDENHWNVS